MNYCAQSLKTEVIVPIWFLFGVIDPPPVDDDVSAPLPPPHRLLSHVQAKPLRIFPAESALALNRTGFSIAIVQKCPSNSWFMPADCPLLDDGPHLDPLVDAALAHGLPQVERLRRAVRDAVGAVGGHAAVGRVAETLGFVGDAAFSPIRAFAN